MTPEMKTTEIKYAIMDRVTGKLLTYETEENVGSYACVDTSHTLHIYEIFPVWYVEDVDTAKYVLENNTYWYNATYNHPKHGIDISPASHCVVKVTMVCTVEILE